MKRYTTWATCLALGLLAGCGSSYVLGKGTVTVLGLAPGQTILCGSTQALVQFAGSGFLSEHGIDVTIRWDAVSGTPFEQGTAATTETVGTVLSDTLFEAQLPDVFGSIPVTVTIILPGGNQGTSPELVLEIGGQLGPPDAVDDAYGTVGNVPLTVTADVGVLFNDADGQCLPTDEQVEEKLRSGSGALSGGSVVAYDATSALGGTVVMQPDGSFTYTPPLGAGNPSGLDDTFTYTLDQGGLQDVAVVTITICETVWFIDDTAPSGGNGQMQAPFDSLTAFMAQQFAGEADDPEEGDWIFVYRGDSGTTPYDDGIVLKAFQKLIGQGVDLVVCGQTLVQATQRPVLTNSGISIGESVGGPVIVLSDANVVRGLTTDSGLVGIQGLFVGGPTLIDEVDIRDPFDIGIVLNGVSGPFQIGDPSTSATVAVEITGGGGDGIQIGGGAPPQTLTALSNGGPSVNVFATNVADFLGNGINCADANLDVDLSTIDGVDSAIVFHTLGQGSEACVLNVVNSDFGLADRIRFRGVEIQNFGADIDATVSSDRMDCAEQCIFAAAQVGPGIAVAFEFNDLTTGVASGGSFPTVELEGIEGGITVTSMRDNRISGVGTAFGILADACIFDANPTTMGLDAVDGGTLDLGSAAGRMDGTSLQLLGCVGTLDFGAVTIFQVGGNPAGYANTGGGLTLSFTPAPIVDHVP